MDWPSVLASPEGDTQGNLWAAFMAGSRKRGCGEESSESNVATRLIQNVVVIECGSESGCSRSPRRGVLRASRPAVAARFAPDPAAVHAERDAAFWAGRELRLTERGCRPDREMRCKAMLAPLPAARGAWEAL